MSWKLRKPTEEEQVVIDLLMSGVDYYFINEKLGITFTEFQSWQDDMPGRMELVQNARLEYRESQEEHSPEVRAKRANEAILQFKEKIIRDEIDRIIEETQK